MHDRHCFAKRWQLLFLLNWLLIETAKLVSWTKGAVLNRLLKFPRPKQAPGRGYILGRIGRDSVETHESDDDLDGTYIDRRPPPHQTIYDQDRHSIVNIGTSSSDESNNDDHHAAKSTTSGESASRKTVYAVEQINIAPPTPSSPKKATIHSSTSFTNLPKMTTRYRFRDLLLGDFSFNDDGERWVLWI